MPQEDNFVEDRRSKMGRQNRCDRRWENGQIVEKQIRIAHQIGNGPQTSRGLQQIKQEQNKVSNAP